MKSLTCITTSEMETMLLGRDIALAIEAGPQSGDLLLLSGDLGTGKTALSRAIIRQLAGNDTLEVPSPTYTLCHVYDFEKPVAHYDLYRLGSLDELEELGWEEQLESGAAIMEWPERCFDVLPDGAVHISIQQNCENIREFTLQGEGEFFDRIARSFEIADFLSEAKIESPSRRHLSADASARSYEIIKSQDEQFFLMNSPSMPDGPIIRDGKPYSQIAHLAENVDAFVGVAKLLRETGAKAPAIPHFDLDKGLLLIEHLGNGSIIDEERKPIPERYLASVEFLAHLHQQDFKNQVQIAKDRNYLVPDYDEEAMLIEAELLLDWYVPEHADNPISPQQAEAFKQIWRSLYRKVSQLEQTLVLRDYHSPNILWLDGNAGIERIGVIDFQDALIGPSSYDVASLAQDARVDVPSDLEKQIVDHYILTRSKGDKAFNEADFRASYAIMAAQRATKILGIFIRLDKRDGKPEYLKHLPRMRDYIKRSLNHAILDEYSNWLETVIKL